MALFTHQLLDVAGRGVERYGDDLRARHHHRSRVPAVEAHSTRQEHVLEPVNKASPRSLGDHQPDLLSAVRSYKLILRLDAKEPDAGVRHVVQQDDEWAEHERVEA